MEVFETERPLIANQKLHKENLRNLFIFATRKDWVLMGLGTLSAVCMGVIQPLLFYFMGEFYNQLGPDVSGEEFYEEAATICLYMVMFGACFVVAAYFAVMLFINVGTNQGMHFRMKYLEKILELDGAWYDKNNVAELPNSITSDTSKVEMATGDKLVIVIFTFSMIVSSAILALVEGTKLSLIAFCFGPVSAGGLYLTNKGMEQNASATYNAYKKAGGIAEETFKEMKTVAAYNAQNYHLKKYTAALEVPHRNMVVGGFKGGMGTGLGIAGFQWMMAVIYIVGAIEVNDQNENWADGETMDVGKVIIVMFVSMIAFNNIGTLVPSFKMISDGKKAAATILNVINTPSETLSGSLKPKLKGSIEFWDVEFSYPSFPDSKVLKQVSFQVDSGKSLGIVGPTGSGKSSVVQLLLRFYDSQSGKILLDGFDIKDYDLSYLRSQVGFVSQEPALFDTTIYENIRYGRLDATNEEIEEAASKVGIYEFVCSLPEKFQTKVGNKGSQLSGGQKQRIAIARAIIRKPCLLLLDEATSALDSSTKREVTQTIETYFESSSVILIAQDLSTVEKCDRIIFIESGEIVESGSHEELMELGGKYCSLFQIQDIQSYSGKEFGTKPKAELQIQTQDKEEVSNFEESKQLGYFKRIILQNKKQVYWLALGCLGSLLVGSMYPLTGMFSGMEIYLLATQEDIIAKSQQYALGIIVLSLVILLGMFLESISYPRLTSTITSNMRTAGFKALVSFEPSYFEEPENKSCASKLSQDCEKVNGLGGSIFGVALAIASSLAVAHGVAGYFSWRLSLVILAIVPILIFAISSVYLAQMTGLVTYSYQRCSEVVWDAVLNYKSVRAYGLKQVMIERYKEPIQTESSKTARRAHWSGFTYGVGFGLIFWVYSLIFWYGAKLVADNDNSFEEMIIAFTTAIIGSDAFFIAGIYMPDMKSGIQAAKSIFKVIDFKPKIEVNSEKGWKPHISGEIEFQDVSFFYPNRSVPALTQVSFTVQPGSSVALIGISGSGKSTIVQLLTRLYDVSSGSIFIDGVNIQDFNLKHLRSQVCLVPQEPILFSGTISENVSYGVECDHNLIMEAIGKAGASEFVQSHQDGLERQVGLHGNQLSGGQKQRIAIARAYIRNPRVLLVDEGTSALDAKTEKLVEEALQDLTQYATTIFISHKLQIIEKAQTAIVLERGRVVESGIVQELRHSGVYLKSLFSV